MSNKVYSISHELFYILTVGLIIFIIMEIFWPNIAQAYISLNFVLILWLLCGIFIINNKEL